MGLRLHMGTRNDWMFVCLFRVIFTKPPKNVIICFPHTAMMKKVSADFRKNKNTYKYIFFPTAATSSGYIHIFWVVHPACHCGHNIWQTPMEYFCYTHSVGLKDELIKCCWSYVTVALTSQHAFCLVNAISQEHLLGILSNLVLMFHLDSRIKWFKFGSQRSKSFSCYKDDFSVLDVAIRNLQMFQLHWLTETCNHGILNILIFKRKETRIQHDLIFHAGGPSISVAALVKTYFPILKFLWWYLNK